MAEYQCPRWYPFVITPIGLLLLLFGITFGVATVFMSFAPATPAEGTPPATDGDLVGMFLFGLLISFFFIGGGARMLFGRAISLTTDGATLRWRAPLARGSRPLGDLWMVKCNRNTTLLFGLMYGAIGALSAAIGHGRNHKLFFREQIWAVHVYTAAGFGSFVEVLEDLHPGLEVYLSPTLPTGVLRRECGFSCERTLIEPDAEAAVVAGPFPGAP